MNSMAIIVRILTIAVLALGGVVLAGYGFHNAAIVGVMPGLKGMSPLTAMAVMVLAAAILAEALRHLQVAKTLAILALIIGGGVLFVHGVAGRDVVSPWVAATLFGYDPATAGRTSIATAGCVVVLAAATLGRSMSKVADWLGAASLIVSGMAILGYAYGVADLYALPIFNTMALHTAVAIGMLSVASLIVRPEAGWAFVLASTQEGGAATRRQLGFILLPPVAGGLLLQATDAHRIGPGAAMAFLVVLTVAPLALLILRDGRMLDAVGRERRDLSDELLRRLSEQAEALKLESSEREKAEAAMARNLRMEAVGQLTGGIAHDFNNLLMSISGNLQLLTKRLSEDHPARRYADNASLATGRGAKLTAQLLAFSRTQKLNVRPVLLDPVLLNAREILGNALGPNIEIEMKLGAKDAWASTDPDQLELAILNLALNARDAMPSGGIITVVSGASERKPDAGPDDQPFLSVKVIDTGEGMSDEVAAQAVEPFFTTKERGKGTGLGLAQVYGFVRQSGGDLCILSQPGMGTTIELLLPWAPSVVSEPVSAHVKSDDETQGSGKGEVILVIDDDDSVRAVLVDTLRLAGFEVVEAGSGREGLERLETLRPAAAIIDFIMPGMNGADVARIAQRMMPNLPIIFVSGYYDTVALDGIFGAVVLRKPFSLEGLNRAISSALH